VGSASAIDTTWDFNGNLAATSGAASMSFRGDMGTNNASFFASEHDLGLPMPFGDNTGVMRFEATSQSQGMTVNLNNGGATISDYTMVWDIFRPGPSWNSWMPLYQTDVSNSTDASFFIDPGDGIGIEGQYSGTVTNARSNISWDRIAITRSADGTMKKFIDGVLVGTQTGLTGSQWDITGGEFNILADNNGESSAGYISSFRVVDSVLSDSVISNLGAVHAGGAATAGQQITTNPALVTPGSFTVAFLGDTQNYSSGNPDVFSQVTQWVADNKAARNIQFLVQDGDIVNSGNSTTQWDNARSALETLDGVVPYAVVRGNHDIGSQFDLASRFGPGSPYSQQPTFVDHYEVPGRPTWDSRNSVHKFEANGQKIMVLTIDISAGDDVVEWANGVIAANRDYRVILDTHAYLYDGGERFNNAPDPNNPGFSHDESRDHLLRPGFASDAVFNGARYGGQDAETLWNNLVSKHSNVSLFVSGHQFEDFDEFKYHLEQGDYGNNVYEMLVDPQHLANGGNGWIRLLEFDADGTTVHVKTYSPFLDQWDTAPDNFYDIELSPLPEFPSGDINGNGVIFGDGTGTFENDDVVAFVSLWQLPSTLDAPNPADLNLDGIANMRDWAILNAENPAMGSAILAAFARQDVPEPGTFLLAAMAWVCLVAGTVRRRVGAKLIRLDRKLPMTRCRPLATLALVLSLALSAQLADAQTKKSLFFGIDGLGFGEQGFSVASTPFMDSLINGSWQSGYQGAYSDQAFAGGVLGTPSQQITVSGPGWSTMLTGVWTDRHGVTGNGSSFASGDYANNPPYLATVKAAIPSLTTVSHVYWPPIDDYIMASVDNDGDPTNDLDFHASYSNDAVAVAAAIDDIDGTSGRDPDAVFISVDLVDGAGHASGSSSSGYRQAVETADNYVGQALAAIASRPSFDNEDWQIVVTSDHGHLPGGGHGGQTQLERTIPFIVASESLNQGAFPLFPQPVSHADAAPTILDHFGVAIPSHYYGVSRAAGGFIGNADINGDLRVAGDGTGTFEYDDVVAFVTLWQQISTIESPNPADLNLDGIANMADWAILNAENPSMGAAILAAFAQQSVPEPGTCFLALVLMAGHCCTARTRTVSQTQQGDPSSNIFSAFL